MLQPELRPTASVPTRSSMFCEPCSSQNRAPDPRRWTLDPRFQALLGATVAVHSRQQHTERPLGGRVVGPRGGRR